MKWASRFSKAKMSTAGIALAISLTVLFQSVAPAVGAMPAADPSPKQRQVKVSSGVPDQTVSEEALGMNPLVLGLLIGVGTVLLQIMLKFLSREPPGNKRHGLVREDLVWWLDWVVAAAISFTILAFSRAHDHGSLEMHQVAGLIFTLVFGVAGLPGLVRAYGYDKSSNPPALRTGTGIVVPNVVGGVILITAVASGASLAG
jgi:hypothetical protein